VRRNRVAEQWNTFAQAVLPKDCSDLQRKEMRRAFYAGAHMLFCMLLGNLSEGGEPKPEDMQMLADMNAECEAFAESIKQGVA
jgi:hypothetical protein